MRTVVALIYSTFSILMTSCSDGDFPVLRGPYLGQSLPEAEPELFAPGIVNTGMYERDVAMTPDGRELYFGLMTSGYVTIVGTVMKDGRWTRPEIVPFAATTDAHHFEPHITPDGEKMLFLTTRRREDQAARPGWGQQNIWAVDRLEDGGWGEPYDLGPQINTDHFEYFPSVTRSGTLYFTRSIPGQGQTTILRSRFVNGVYDEPEKVPGPINEQRGIYNTFIDPDERYLIACVEGRDDVITPGLTNYYVFFRKPDDTWSEPIQMGEKINYPGARALSPYVSPDGKLFFFASTNLRELSGPGEEAYSFELLKKIHAQPQNGNGDIYWVDAAVIESLRPEGF